jgi:GT2 family glycosyltransferase
MIVRDAAAIVLNFNGGAATLECVASLLDEVESIVVVDNGSTDGSAEAIERRFGERVRVEKLGSNRGISIARNIGVKAADAQYLLFVDADATVSPGTTAALRAAFDDDARIAVAGPVILDAHRDEIVQTTGGTIDRWGFPIDATNGLRARDLSSEGVRDAFYVSACTMMIAARTFARLRGFDEGMFFACEDVDICWRSWLAGYRVVSVRNAFVRHMGGSSLAFTVRGSLYTPALRDGGYQTSWSRIVAREANAFRMMVANLALYLCAWLPVVVAETIAFFAIGRWRIAAAYLAALARIARALPSTLRHRRAVQATRARSDRAITRMWSRGYEKFAFLRRNGVPEALMPRTRP